ncbi:hypothetical protein Bca52824_062246 [Brassica carinata]|uniref:Uncharacterized protein n=1 Tax=Brassica carinata TaxID=52824 RepID=A0A8X7U803_BRACI|nr:hypothetical protein Bca52824_062246 [Brassica carinata]
MVDSLFPSIETTVDDASLESRQKRRRISETAKEADSSEINQESSRDGEPIVQQIYAQARRLKAEVRRYPTTAVKSPLPPRYDTADRSSPLAGLSTTQRAWRFSHRPEAVRRNTKR